MVREGDDGTYHLKTCTHDLCDTVFCDNCSWNPSECWNCEEDFCAKHIVKVENNIWLCPNCRIKYNRGEFIIA